MFYDIFCVLASSQVLIKIYFKIMEEVMQKKSKLFNFHSKVFLFLFLSIFFIRDDYVRADEFSITQIQKHFSYLIEEEEWKCNKQHGVECKNCQKKYGVELKGLAKCWQQAHNTPPLRKTDPFLSK